MNRKNLKSGFTLIELMAFFIFISLLIAASTPIITKRVRDLPKKINHGMHICYRDEGGGLVEKYYNASQEVPGGGPVDSCRFDAPKSAALFKIDIIGAGAGGYNFHNVTSEDDDRSGTYKLDGTTSGSDTLVPSDEQLRQLMDGQIIRTTAYTGKGGNGSGLNYSYVDPEAIQCEINSANNYDTDPTMPYCAKALEPGAEGGDTPSTGNIHPDPSGPPQTRHGLCQAAQRPPLGGQILSGVAGWKKALPECLRPHRGGVRGKAGGTDSPDEGGDYRPPLRGQHGIPRRGKPQEESHRRLPAGESRCDQ